MIIEVFLHRNKHQIRIYEYVCLLNGEIVAAWGFEIFKLSRKSSTSVSRGGVRGYATQADAILDAGAAVDQLVSQKIKTASLDVIDLIQEGRKAYRFLRNYAQAA